MSKQFPLIEFETEYPKLYEILVNGVPVYTALRDGVNARLNGGGTNVAKSSSSENSRVSIRRVLDSIVKLRRLKNAKTLVFTSAVYRRDKGRNLAAEYLMDKYPDTVVFEWPARNEDFDFAYFKDEQKDRYCPLEWYLIKYKLYMRFHSKEYNRYCSECREKLAKILPANTGGLPDNYIKTIEYIKSAMPNSYAEIIISQKIFKKLFKKYRNIEYAIDFWGSARENIIPVLPGKPQSVELQHGAFNAVAMPGYIYPKFVRNLDFSFFNRTILVYGVKSKIILTKESIFKESNVHVIGNPRLEKYKREFETKKSNKGIILFVSQTFEQDGTGYDYYDTVIPILKKIQEIILTDEGWKGIKLGIKLHPRENQAAMKRYKEELPTAEIYGSNTQLYELFSTTLLLIMVSSTALFEAAEFSVPSVMIEYNGITAQNTFGFPVKSMRYTKDVELTMKELSSKEEYNSYLSYIVDKARENI